MALVEAENPNEIVDVLSVSPAKKIDEQEEKKKVDITSFEQLLDVVSSELHRSDPSTHKTGVVDQSVGLNLNNLHEEDRRGPMAILPDSEDFVDNSPTFCPRDDDEFSISSGASAALRKDKSLGLLCHRFLNCMKEQSANGQSIHLETSAQILQVEKRRIYDIVNVMEALEAMKKQTKSYYSWNGLDHLPHLMFQLKEQAVAEKLPDKIMEVERAMCSFTELIQRRRSAAAKSRAKKKEELVGTTLSQDSGYSSNGSQDSLNHIGSDFDDELFHSPDGPVFIQVLEDETEKNEQKAKASSGGGRVEKERQTNGRVSLDVASTLLVKDPDAKGFEPPSRSKCRRLYDIANVLVAMNLIKKVHYLFGTKKIPLFVYSGPPPFENADRKISRSRSDMFLPPPILEKENSPRKSAFKRHSSLLEMCEIASQERDRLHKEAQETTQAVAQLRCSESEEKPLNLALKDRKPTQGETKSTVLPKSDYRVNIHGLLVRPETKGQAQITPSERPSPLSVPYVHRPIPKPPVPQPQRTIPNLSRPALPVVPQYLIREPPGQQQYFLQNGTPVPRPGTGFTVPRVPVPTTVVATGGKAAYSLHAAWSTGILTTGTGPGVFYSTAPGVVARPPAGIILPAAPVSWRKSPEPKKRLLEEALTNPPKRFAIGTTEKLARKSVIIPSILRQNQPIGTGHGQGPKVVTESVGTCESAFTTVRKNIIKSPGKGF